MYYRTSSEKPITLAQAKSIARHLGFTLRQARCGGYRVNFRDGNANTAQYTDKLDDAIRTAIGMARERALLTAPAESLP